MPTAPRRPALLVALAPGLAIFAATSRRPALLVALALGLPMFATACDGDSAPQAGPATAADALLREVQKRGYRDWERAPKHEARVATNAPHGRGVEVFVDEHMAEALANADGLGRTAWPEGATIVLEGYAASVLAEDAPPDEPVQLAILQKRGGSWHWEQYQAEDLEHPRFAGRPDVCVGCHLGSQDFVRGFSLPKPVEEE